MKREVEEGRIDEQKLVFDSSLDYKGKFPVRASTGVWKASFFIIALELSERMSFFGIQANLMTYMTRALHQDLKTAAENVNYWAGVTKMLPLIGAFIADSYLGRYSTVLISSTIYIMALSLLILSQFIPSLKPCDMNPCHKSNMHHQVIFFVALYMISIATGGHKPALESFGADQFDNDHSAERKKKLSFFNLWCFTLSSGLLLGVTVLVYVMDYISWGAAFIVLASAMAITTGIFFLGRTFYRYNMPDGSPLTPMLQVLVAAIAKRNLPPLNPSELYEVPKSEGNKRLLTYTNRLRFLDKAAIMEHPKENEMESTNNPNPWRLQPVSQVESLKLVVNMVPIWLTGCGIGLCTSQAHTFFIKQAGSMDRRLPSNFEIPPASILLFGATAMMITLFIYDRMLIPILRRFTGNERGISVLQRIGIGMAISVSAMVMAALVERRRLASAATSSVKMSVFWLAPQFYILGIGESFSLVGLQEFFYDQVPDTMRSLGISFFLSVLGVSDFISSFLISISDRLTRSEGGKNGWFGKDLNTSHLDYFYWLIATISGISFCAYMLLAANYSYKKVEKR